MNDPLGPPVYGADNALWPSVLDSLRGRLSARKLEEIEQSSRSLERTTSSLRVTVQQSALSDWLHDGRLSLLDASLTALTDGGAELAVLPVPAVDAGDPTRELERFIASPANQEACATARALASGSMDHEPAVLFHGPPGAGKTHLLRGIADGLRSAGQNVVLQAAEQLTLELVAALRGNRLDAFREPLRSCDALIVDDLHALIGREASQDELAAVIADRESQGRVVVLSTRLTPLDRSELREALRTSLARVQSVTVSTPEWETRVAIILERVAAWGVRTNPEVAALLASSLGAALGRLDAVLTRLMTHPASAAGLVDPELVRRILESGGPVVSSARPQEVIRLVSQHFSVRPADLSSPAKSRRVTTPRQLAMYLLRHHCGLSYPEIGQRFRRHHTTAIHACKKIESERDRNAGLRATVLLLEKELLRVSETVEN